MKNIHGTYSCTHEHMQLKAYKFNVPLYIFPSQQKASYCPKCREIVTTLVTLSSSHSLPSSHNVTYKTDFLHKNFLCQIIKISFMLYKSTLLPFLQLRYLHSILAKISIINIYGKRNIQGKKLIFSNEIEIRRKKLCNYIIVLNFYSFIVLRHRFFICFLLFD